MGFEGLIHLTNDYHPYQLFNIKTLMNCNAVDRILNGIQDIIDERKQFTVELVESVIQLLRNLVNSINFCTILSSISDFLIAINCPEDTFVCHASENFYFSLKKASVKKLKTLTSKTSLKMKHLEIYDENQSPIVRAMSSSEDYNDIDKHKNKLSVECDEKSLIV